MAKKKAKKKGSAGKIAAGFLALALIGGAIGGDEPAENVDDDTVTYSVSDVADPGRQNDSEELTTSETDQAPPPAKDELQAEQNPAPTTEEKAEQKDPVVQAPPTEEKKPAPTIDPETAFREKLKQYNYVCSTSSDKYHYPTCRWTSKINDSNLAHFDTEEEAVAAGYVPCGTCKP